MKTINFFKTVICLLTLSLTFSCSSDEDSIAPIDTRSFITDSNVDYFINRDGTVNIIVSGEYTDSDSPNFGGDVANRGFVYGKTTNSVVNSNNTETALGSNPVNATFRNLDAGQTIYIRGFFEMSDGTYFYGNEIQTSTTIDASSTRSISMTIKPDLFFQNFSKILNDDSNIILNDKKNNITIKKVKVLTCLILLFLIILFIGLYVR